MIFRILSYILFLCLTFGCNDPRSEREKVRDNILIQFSKQMQPKKLYAAGLGGGCSLSKKINLVDVTFDYQEIMDIESARKLIVESTNDLLILINSDVNNKDYFEEFPVKVDTLSISIIGQLPELPNDYIRMVSVFNGNVYYCTDDPTGKVMPFIHVHEETFEEAENLLSQQSGKT